MTRKPIVAILLTAFLGSSVQMPLYAQVDPIPFMPQPGSMVHLSPDFTPAHLEGIVVHPENPLMFDFIVGRGDDHLSAQDKKDEYTKLIKYFLASLAIHDEDQWVNLSPYEKNRIIKDDFGKTLMGRDLLSQDYILKQITASLIYPEDRLGKEFWSRIYTKAQQEYGTSNVPVNTFNKVWIIPDNAELYEKGNAVFLIKSHLKVMLEEDYLSLSKHSALSSTVIPRHALASQLIRQLVLPELEKEVNEGKNFALLRQAYSGMILAAWYKHALKRSLLGVIYANKGKVKGVDQDPRNNEAIYQRYLQAYKKGVFNYIKEDSDSLSGQPLPRKYFSGGVAPMNFAKIVHFDSPAQGDGAMKAILENEPDDVLWIGMKAALSDTAMTVDVLKEVSLINSIWKAVIASNGSGDLFQIGNEGAMVNRNVDRAWVFLDSLSRKVPGLKVKKYRRTSYDLLSFDSYGVKLSLSLSYRMSRKLLNPKTDIRAGLIQEVKNALIAKSEELSGQYPQYREKLEPLKVYSWDDPAVNKRTYSAADTQAIRRAIIAGVKFNKPLNENDVQKMGFGVLGQDVFITPFSHGRAINNILDGKHAVFWVRHDRKEGSWIRGADAKRYTTRANEVLLHEITIKKPFRQITVLYTNNWDNAQTVVNPVKVPGGIDLNSTNLSMLIKRDGRGVVLPIAQQDLAQLSQIDGLMPVILSIKPASQTSLLSQLR